MTNPFNLEDYRIQGVPSAAYYIPDFISKEEEKLLLTKVYNAPKPKWVALKSRRLQNWGGALTNKGAMLPEPLPDWLTATIFERFKQFGLVFGDSGEAKDQVPNHVLVNEYLAGQGILPHEDGPFYYPTVATISLASHTVLDFYTHTIIPINEPSQPTSEQPSEPSSVTPPASRPPGFSLYLGPRSLFVQCGDLYKHHLHGISAAEEEDFRDDGVPGRLWDRLKNRDAIIGLGGAVQEGGEAAGGEYVWKRDVRVSLTYRRVKRIVKAKVFGAVGR